MSGDGCDPSHGLKWCGPGLLLGLLLLGTGCDNTDQGKGETSQDAESPVLVVKLASEQPPGEVGRLVVAQTSGGNRLRIRTLGGSHTALASGVKADVSCSPVRLGGQLTYFTVHATDGGTALLHAQLLQVSADAAGSSDGGASECETAGESLASQALVITATGTAPTGGGDTTPDAGDGSDTDNDGGLDAGS